MKKIFLALVIFFGMMLINITGVFIFHCFFGSMGPLAIAWGLVTGFGGIMTYNFLSN